MIKSQFKRYLILSCFSFILTCAGCSLRLSPAPGIQPPPIPPTTETPAPPSTATPPASPTALPTATQTLPPTPSPTTTQTPTLTPTVTVTPTYAILRGEVLVHSACLYGPGAVYLYKYGLLPGSNLDVIGRNDLGTWILVQAIGGNNPCWLKASLMKVKGDVMTVAPTYYPLPQSPYYSALTNVWAIRQGDKVTVSWDPKALRPGDETSSPPYLVEAWICTAGQLIFTPVGSYQNFVTLVDEPGCAEPSHARVFFVEKHGYTRWVKVPWPVFTP